MVVNAGVSCVGYGYGIATMNDILGHVTTRCCSGVITARSNTQQTLYENLLCSTQDSSQWFPSRLVLPLAYFATVQAIVRHVNFEQIKCLLLGSPGFVKDDFFEFLNLEAVRREQRVRLARTTYFWPVDGRRPMCGGRPLFGSSVKIVTM